MKNNHRLPQIPPPPDSLEIMQQRLAQMQLMRQAGVNPGLLFNAWQCDRPGFVLPKMAQQRIIGQAMLNGVQGQNYSPPSVEEQKGITIGHQSARGTPVRIPLEAVGENIGVFGASGSGKTNFIFWIIDYLLKQSIVIRFWDFKGEATRLPKIWPGAMVFTPSTAPFDFLVPAGDPMAYYTGIIGDLRLEFELRPETFPLLWGIWERILRGMKPGDPYPSWEDFRRVVEAEAIRQKRENLNTAQRAIMNICVVLGPKQSRARKVPDISGKYPLVGYDFVGQDPAIFRLFLGFHFTKLILKAQEEGHSTALKAVEIIDEGGMVFSKELMNRGVTHISSAKRFSTMARFTGTGLIVGGQNISQIDSFLKQNCATILVFRTPSVDDALEASKMLGLPRESIDELMRLKKGEAYVRSVGWEQPVKVQVPLFST